MDNLEKQVIQITEVENTEQINQVSSTVIDSPVSSKIKVKNAEQVNQAPKGVDSCHVAINTDVSETPLEDWVHLASSSTNTPVKGGESSNDLNDVELSTLEAVPSLVDQSFTIDDMEFIPNPEANEVYNNVMKVCSTTAEAIKKTISEVLNSRDDIVITTGDVTHELEESLSRRIADFENVVSGCFPGSFGVDSDEPASKPVSIVEIVEETDKISEDSTVNSEAIAAHVPDQRMQINCAISINSTDIKNSNDASDLNYDLSVTDGKKSEQIEKCDITNVETSLPQSEVKLFPKELVKNTITADEERGTKKQQKNNAAKKKGERTIDQVLKSLPNCSTLEEKLQCLLKKHVAVLEELRNLESHAKQLERQATTQRREKEVLQAEHNRMILAKSRLESLCRELQRQNRAVKEESLLRIKEEEEKRKEVANKFQVTLNDISALMQENSKKNIQLREENTELAKKLKALVDHYEMWEKHMEKVVHQKDLEVQLSKAKHAKINLLLKQETEKFLKEKQALLENMSELQKKCTMLTSNELQLRTELGDYTTKYEEFQSVLSKSSQVFATFKTDMEATSKKIKKLEKETNVYKQKWESSNNALLGMINDKQKHDKELANAQQRILTLEKLCRALQAERNELQNQVNVLSSGSSTSEKDVPSITPEAELA
ncbi:alpha-taxilin-like [Stegodyphus dumicola]|uniref:alpha-taxilin-like n=1 Tax=Stegodyphus dumicola TaxID=202533 RepID=UPI0015B0D91B|nr:alpha-taxilin-like [Stegodyphus dumicola]XP_035213163.1 alpha-taxilin-like [Stegodyphus dumicola]XP_035213165.1 alpha-taxilin-like [Stegodyphus dumicola]